ncbi:MAG TPA: SHOCT domain-containing protein, partial [Acidimicrobiales bacterium]|nr:SHOCT domain-containing protein [Acidimicrobiales bacterium]
MNRYGPFAFHHGHALFAWFFLALVGALVALGVLAVILLWRRAARTGPFRGVGSVPAAPSDPAVAEVRMRYARGEISSEDYARRLADLGYPMAPGQWPPVPGSVAPTPTPPP